MKAVQCYDGDGVVPPEIVALIEENKRLKEIIKKKDENIEMLCDEIREMQLKGWSGREVEWQFEEA